MNPASYGLGTVPSTYNPDHTLALTPGTRLGVYEITAHIGEGGMGQVCRARDTKLDRDVALKVLPDAFANDADRLARFTREAQTLALLNHPNIAGIYGLEESGGVRALVMELVEGEDLSQRISRGAMPVAEVLAIARQLADALEAAHERGVIHRDLKPANIKVRPDGAVKVLDFGLAKAMDPAGATSQISISQSPTMATRHPEQGQGVTQMGMILGTVPYMAPEQASGRPVDKRADIWAFGVVLWEMLTGRQLFEGETISHVMAAVLTKEPDLGAVPQSVRLLLTRCLEKDPRKRLRDIGDAMVLVQNSETLASGAELRSSGVARARKWLGGGGWVLAGALAAGFAVAAWIRQAPVADADPPIVRFQIERAADIYNATATAFAVSPDGLMLAHYGAAGDGQQDLFVRTLASGEVRQVQGASAFAPQRDALFWSPDSKQLVLGTVSSARVLDVSTGTTRPLCECRFIGGSWSREGVILLGSVPNAADGIRSLSVGDRTPVTVTKVDASRGERDTWPVFLPDGRRFLFTRATPGGGVATYLGTLDADPPKRIADGSRRVFVPASADRSAYLLGIDASGLVAQAFDLNTLSVTGAAVTVVPNAIAVSASVNGVLTTSAAGTRPQSMPTWFDRKGVSLGGVGEAGQIESFALSPDGRRLAVGDNPGSGNSDIWLRDLVSGANTRATFNPGNEGTPVWSPDGTRIAFSSLRNGVQSPYQRAADGTGAEIPLFAADGSAWVNDWSSDGRWVIYSTVGPDGIGNDLWVVPMGNGTARTPVPYIVGPARQQQAQFSPDGRFVAYGSDQSGTWEIYVQPFPNASDGKWMVSRDGGVEPRWSRDGKELYYFSGQTLMTVPVSVRPTFSNGAPAALFNAPVQPGFTNDGHRWQVAPDGKRFLLLINAGQDKATPLEVVVNWQPLLKK